MALTTRATASRRVSFDGSVQGQPSSKEGFRCINQDRAAIEISASIAALSLAICGSPLGLEGALQLILGSSVKGFDRAHGFLYALSGAGTKNCGPFFILTFAVASGVRGCGTERGMLRAFVLPQPSSDQSRCWKCGRRASRRREGTWWVAAREELRWSRRLPRQTARAGPTRLRRPRAS